MSICTTESLQSVRELDRMHNWQDRQAQAEADMAYEFTRSIELGDPDATPDWTGTGTDYERVRALGLSYGDKNLPRRRYTVAECLQSALDYNNGASLTDVVKVLSLALKCSDPMVALAARQLVERAANRYAEHNVEVE